MSATANRNNERGARPVIYDRSRFQSTRAGVGIGLVCCDILKLMCYTASVGEVDRGQGLLNHPPKGRPMKRPILLSVVMLLSASAVQAVTFTTCGASGDQGPTQSMCDTAYGGAIVSVSGGIQTWTVPATGTYRIKATGAQGASAAEGHVGGRGASIVGQFNLVAGQTLKLAVGQQGSGQSSGSNGGGGGGSFVVSSADLPLLIAGGGGGTRTGAGQDGCDASITHFAGTGSGDNDTSSCSLKTSGAGQGGIITSPDEYGAAGAGFYSDGETDVGTHGGGYDWLNGMLGGASDCTTCGFPAVGGFGGGGDGRGDYGGGGGGGYSGGDGGWIAGGGASYNTGTNPFATAGVGTGDGSIEIQTVSNPAPALSVYAMILLSGLLALVGVAMLRRRQRRTAST